MILLGKNPGLVQKSANVGIPVECEDDSYVLAAALKRANIENIQITEPQPVNVEDDASSTNSPTGSISSTSAAEKDGLLYVAGYLAKNFLKEYSSLGR